MRIGIDALAVQSPAHGHRGIGRYARHLIESLHAVRRDHELILYGHSDLPSNRLPVGPVRWLDSPGSSHLGDRIDQWLVSNPDHLDVWLVLDPFEPWSRHAAPSRPRGGPRLAAVIYDLIPLRFQDEPGATRLPGHYVRAVDRVRRYDLLLAISDATRRDVLDVLKIEAERVATIGGAADPSLFSPPRTPEPSAPDLAILRRLGITRPYVLSVAGFDPRKNLDGLLGAFATLPEPLRRGHQLVLTFDVQPEDAQGLRQAARRLGIGDAIVVTGRVSDADLACLYQRCAAFALPSFYEGFGLPILEAMQSGAAVVAGDNSSQPEVLGDAGLLANASDPSAIAAQFERLLTDSSLVHTLRERALRRSGQFSWASTAERAIRAIEGMPKVPAWMARTRLRRRPRIAFLSPLAPAQSGVADYAQRLIQQLIQRYDIDLFHDHRYVPDAAWDRTEGLTCHDARLLERTRPHRDYRAIVYQMGNSPYHQFLYPRMMNCPGVATIHDLRLAGFHLWYGHTLGRQREFLAEELAYDCPDAAPRLLVELDRHGDDPEQFVQACGRAGADCIRRIVERSHVVVVHSPWCRDRIVERFPDLTNRVMVIPHGATIRTITEEDRQAVRARFEIPPDALVLAAFGFVHPDKLIPEILDAFDQLADAHPEAILLLVGADSDNGLTRRKAETVRHRARVQFLGRRDDADFLDLIAATDIGLSLRKPPTYGETSGALLHLLRSGVATIVTDVGTFADYPDAAVTKLGWDDDGPRRLLEVMRRLADEPARRAAMAAAALRHVDQHHDWRLVAERYFDAIEQCRAVRSRSIPAA